MTPRVRDPARSARMVDYSDQERGTNARRRSGHTDGQQQIGSPLLESGCVAWPARARSARPHVGRRLVV